MITLYYLKGACSFVPHYYVMQTPGAESVEASRTYLKSPEFLAINPQGVAPCLVEDGLVITQAMGIIEYLNERFPELHIWGSGDMKVRATARRWFAFCNSDLHKAFSPLFNPAKVAADVSAYRSVQDKSRQTIEAYFEILNAQLADKPFLAGEKTAADLYLFTCLRWAKVAVNVDTTAFEHLERFYARMLEDEALVATLNAESLES